MGGQLSRKDILKENKNNRLIFPFNKKNLKAASYDLTPTIIAMSSKIGMLETVYQENGYKEDRYYIRVHPKDTVLIISNEYIVMPPNIAGYISSRVSKVVEGLGHISTTIDPNWTGALLIAVSNPSNQMLKIYVGDSPNILNQPNQLATVTFHYLKSSCVTNDVDKNHKGMRVDLLDRLSFNNRRGIKAFFRYWIHPFRREFTLYFLRTVEQYNGQFTVQQWKKFLKEFSFLKVKNKNSRKLFSSKKSKKTVEDFIVTENWVIWVAHFIQKYKRFFVALIVIALFVLYRMDRVPDEVKNFIIDLGKFLFGG